MLHIVGGLVLIDFAVILTGALGVMMSTSSRVRDRWYAVAGVGLILVCLIVIGALIIGGVRLITST